MCVHCVLQAPERMMDEQKVQQVSLDVGWSGPSQSSSLKLGCHYIKALACFENQQQS